MLTKHSNHLNPLPTRRPSPPNSRLPKPLFLHQHQQLYRARPFLLEEAIDLSPRH